MNNFNSMNFEFKELEKRVVNLYPQFSNNNKRIATFFRMNQHMVALLNLDEISKKIGVSRSSVLRYIKEIGLSGFKELQTIYKENASINFEEPGFTEKNSLCYHSNRKTKSLDHKSIYLDFIKKDFDCMNALKNSVTNASLDKAVNLIVNADTIYLSGHNRSEPIAIYIQYILSTINKRFYLLNVNSQSLSKESIKFSTKKDVLISTSFQFYTEHVVEITDLAQKNGTKVISFTDGTFSPLEKLSDVSFNIPQAKYLFSRSIAPTMNLILAILTSVAIQLEKK